VVAAPASYSGASPRLTDGFSIIRQRAPKPIEEENSRHKGKKPRPVDVLKMKSGTKVCALEQYSKRLWKIGKKKKNIGRGRETPPGFAAALLLLALFNSRIMLSFEEPKHHRQKRHRAI